MRIAAISLMVLFSNTFLYKECCRLWEVPGVKIGALKKHDVVIVLGGMMEYNNDLKRISLQHSGDRIWQALNLYHAKKVSKILISGDNGYLLGNGLHEAQQMKDELVRWGIPEKDILAETISINTYENAVETRKLLTRSYPQCTKFILVTSARHMRRSIGCFENVGMKITPYSTDHITGPTRSYSIDEYFIPSISTLEDWQGLIKEWIGYVAYTLTGKI